MLERSNGDQGSYLEIADAIVRQSAQATEDLRELWRRIAFSILISNFDDHLRNHGFLRTSSSGWSLSPAFDLNPDPRPGERHLRTAIDFDDTEASVDLLLSVADEFRLSEAESLTVLGEVSATTSAWRSVAETFEADDSEIKVMARAFEHDEATKARELTGV
jgi:serine/threonine-protein kinase HipA